MTSTPKPDEQTEAARIEAVEDEAVSWLLAVRKYGLERANKMFPEG